MASQANPSEKPTMLTYIEQTPAQLKLNVERSEELTAELVDLYAQKPCHSIWIVACGSSSNGSQCARYFMMKYLQREVKIVSPGCIRIQEQYKEKYQQQYNNNSKVV